MDDPSGAIALAFIKFFYGSLITNSLGGIKLFLDLLIVLQAEQCSPNHRIYRPHEIRWTILHGDTTALGFDTSCS